MKIGIFQQIKVREEAHLIKPSSNHSIKHKVIQTNNGGSYRAKKSESADDDDDDDDYDESSLKMMKYSLFGCSSVPPSN